MFDDYAREPEENEEDPNSEGIGMVEVTPGGKPVYGMIDESDKTLVALKEEGAKFGDTEDAPEGLK